MFATRQTEEGFTIDSKLHVKLFFSLTESGRTDVALSLKRVTKRLYNATMTSHIEICVSPHSKGGKCGLCQFIVILPKCRHFEGIYDRRDTGTLTLSSYPEPTPYCAFVSHVCPRISEI